MRAEPKKLAVALIRGYQIWISPLKIFFGAPGGSCRYYPTCSEYAVQAVETHGFFKGLFFGFCRIMRCHPWGGQGYDPVPLKSDKKAPCACCQQAGHQEHFHG